MDALDAAKEELRIAQNELAELKKTAKGENLKPNITIQIDKNAKNPFATLRAEIEHARDIAKGTVPNQKQQHFSRYEGMNEGEAAVDYTYKKSVGRNRAINAAQEIENIKARNQKDLADGYQFREEPNLDYEKGVRIKIDNPEGQELGYLDYNIEGDTLHIQQVTNTTKRKIDYKTGEKIPKKEGEVPSTPLVADRLTDYLLSKFPDAKKIQWDAATPDGVRFKEQYLNQNPSLKEKTHGLTTQEDIDESLKNDYNGRGGVSNEEGNLSQYPSGSGGELGENTLSNDSSKTIPDSQKTGESILGQKGNILQGDSRIDTGRNITNSDTPPQQLKLNFSSTEDAVNKLTSGEVGNNTLASLDAAITKLI